MPAKTPIYLKAGNSKKGKKFKLRDILSPDLISPPLGDFRHTIHIGKDGQHDVFGDISFLQGNYELLPGNQGKHKNGHYNGHNEFFRANSTCDSMFSETSSPVLKNAISLPTIGGSQALVLPLLSTMTFNSRRDSFSPSKLPRLSCEPVIEEKLLEKHQPYENGHRYEHESSWKVSGSASCSTNGRSSHSSSLSEQYNDWQAIDLFEDSQIPCEIESSDLKQEESLSDIAGSLLTLQLDLGPSLLDEVLHVMDKDKA
ncbi:cdc42 effector protein 3 [Bombina bombina]|uniref:cdc42 effector protein 3 n=1 Tax=Bombina bombina TaxID=8345 RepID=UPI00235A9168|nr:cdc42 effector protein 3 [Bombina bombina]